MANCTATYWNEIVDGDCAILRLADPQGVPYNVAFRLDTDEGKHPWGQGQALGRDNDGAPPQKVLHRLQTIINHRTQTPSFQTPLHDMATTNAEGPDLHPLEQAHLRAVHRTGPYRPSNARRAKQRAKTRQLAVSTQKASTHHE